MTTKSVFMHFHFLMVGNELVGRGRQTMGKREIKRWKVTRDIKEEGERLTEVTINNS